MNGARGCAVVVLLWIANQSNAAAPAAEAVDLEALREFHLRDIHVLRDYRPGKNSFVEGPDRRIGSYTAAGQKLTLLDVKGQGSLCHIWSTWAQGKGNHRLDFYLDGADRPQISGTLDELIAAARRMTDAPAPAAGFVGQRNARNLFLPAPFERGLRIEMTTLEPTWLIFWQIDYRTGDASRAGQRLQAAMVEGQLRFQWEGRVAGRAPEKPRLERVKGEVAVERGALGELARVAGPGIIRKWSIATDVPLTEQNGLDLEMRFEGGRQAAVRAPVGDFFGPFKGASLFTDAASGKRACYLPAPFKDSAAIAIRNRLDRAIKASVEIEVERVEKWDARWGYFHAVGRQSNRTLGFRQHPVSHVRGRGHWLGMALYDTGHDHGGGDFAVIDAEGENPAFLHGINGEDYFTFAWFGRGEHHPYAVAHTNEQGRYRHHFENPYPFQKSLNLYWGVYPDLATRSVSYWYQDSPADTTVADEKNPLNVEWDCFGPVPLKLDEKHRPAGDPFAVLPSVADLDAGKKFECRCVKETFTSGWMKQRSFGPMLDLTYLSRHGTKIKGENELGGMGHAFVARRAIDSPAARTAVFQISHDDPIRVLVNGEEVFVGGSENGFVSRRFGVKLKQGSNEVIVQLTSFFNVNFNWAGFALREAEGK